MEFRTMEITLQSGRDLNKDNLVTKMDVYAVVSMSGGDKSSKQEIRTPVDHGGDANPTWNFPMKFKVDEAALQLTRLTLDFKLVCELASGDDKDIGKLSVWIKELLDSPAMVVSDGEKFLTYPVRTPSGEPKGELNFTCKFSDENASGLMKKIYYGVEMGNALVSSGVELGSAAASSGVKLASSAVTLGSAAASSGLEMAKAVGWGAKKKWEEYGEKKRREEFAKKRKDIHKKEVEELRKKREEELAAKKRKEELAAKKRKEEELAKQRKEELAKKKKEEEVAKKKKEELAKKKKEEELAKKREDLRKNSAQTQNQTESLSRPVLTKLRPWAKLKNGALSYYHYKKMYNHATKITGGPPTMEGTTVFFKIAAEIPVARMPPVITDSAAAGIVNIN